MAKYGIMRLKNQGKLYHRPMIIHYFVAILFDKKLKEITREGLERAKQQFIAIVSKYWYDRRFKRYQIVYILKDYETIFRKMYERFPQAPMSYNVFWKIMSSKK